MNFGTNGFSLRFLKISVAYLFPHLLLFDEEILILSDEETLIIFLNYKMKKKFYLLRSKKMKKMVLLTMGRTLLLAILGLPLTLSAQNMKWNGNTEQLTAGAGETVYIRHEGLTMEGAGFSASGISRTYSFDYDVAGVYDDTSDETSDENKVEESE